MKLMIAGHLFGDGSATEILKDDEVTDEIQEPPLLENPLDHDLEFWHKRWSEGFTSDRSPRFKPFPACRQRSDPGLYSVRN
jgi:hypothetical protein